jgi:hypothetical protein
VPITITGIARKSGPGCDHIVVSVDDEGTPRTIDTSFPEVDALIERLGGPLQAKRDLVLLWAAYRRSQTRVVIGVDIA